MPAFHSSLSNAKFLPCVDGLIEKYRVFKKTPEFSLFCHDNFDLSKRICSRNLKCSKVDSKPLLAFLISSPVREGLLTSVEIKQMKILSYAFSG